MSGGGDFYHCRLKAMSRGAGKSAVACAAYRAGMALHDERYGTLRDFSRKGDVVTSFTLAPEAAPDWARDVAQLWNRVEAQERRKDSQLAFEWEVALPHELDDAEREAVARRFAGWLSDEYGTALTVGIHSGGHRGNGLNDHMHVMMTTRAVGEDGFAAKKLPHFSVRPGARNPEVERVREKVAELLNDALEDAGSDTRVDHRSFKERGIEREPTRHLGPAATAYERRGMVTDRGDINRDIIEERLRWQLEEAQPDIDTTLAREFTARFGDAPELWEAAAGLAPEPPIDLGGAAEPQDLSERAAKARGQAEPESHTGAEFAGQVDAGERVSPWGRAWRAFGDRARRFGERLTEIWDDETSGSPEDAGAWVSRAFDAGRRVWQGWQQRDAGAILGVLTEAAEAWRDHVQRGEGWRTREEARGEPEEPPPDEPQREPARPGAKVDAPEPDAAPQAEGEAEITPRDGAGPAWMEEFSAFEAEENPSPEGGGDAMPEEQQPEPDDGPEPEF